MTKVKVRSKPISRGRRTVFLDYYPPIIDPNTHKKVRWEYLDLYIWDKCKTQNQKDENKQTMALAETIRSRRQIDIQNKNYDFRHEDELGKDFLEYFKSLGEKRLIGNKGTWDCTLYYLKIFCKGSLCFRDLNKKYCNEFKEYLLKAPRIRSPRRTISQNSAQGYYSKFKCAIRQAFKDEILKTDLSMHIERIKDSDSYIRQYLTLEELNKLVHTECTLPIVKRAALFSALTGLRFSDVKKLVWQEVQEDKDENGEPIYSIHFIQQKTRGSQVQPISNQAFQLMGKRRASSEVVFESLYYSAFHNYHLKQWILAAGITKNITFHCFRHTFATLQLSKGTDLYTISKMLGHRDIGTTQIYVKVMDIDKRTAANKIQLDF